MASGGKWHCCCFTRILVMEVPRGFWEISDVENETLEESLVHKQDDV